MTQLSQHTANGICRFHQAFFVPRTWNFRLNVLAVIVQAAFFEAPSIENEDDETLTSVTGHLVCTENRCARVLKEFRAQVPKHDTPISLVQAHCGVVIL